MKSTITKMKNLKSKLVVKSSKIENNEEPTLIGFIAFLCFFAMGVACFIIGLNIFQ